MDIENKLKYLRNEVAEAVSILAMCGDKTPFEQLGKKLCDAINNSAVPAQQVKDIEVTDQMASAFNQAICDDAMNDQDIEDVKTGLRAAISHLQPLPLSFYELEISRLTAINKSLLDNERRLLDRVRNIQPSPAVEVPLSVDISFIEDCLIAYKSGLYFDGAEGLRNKINQQLSALKSPSPSITDHPETILSNASQWSERIAEQEFSDEEYICIRDAVDRLISAVGKDVDGDESESSLCADFIDDIIANVIVPLKIEWFQEDEDCGYTHSAAGRQRMARASCDRVTEQDAQEIALTDEEITGIFNRFHISQSENRTDFARAIERALLNKLNAKPESVGG